MAVVINGSGTVTGLAVGGLPDGTVDAGTLATDSVTAVKIPDTVEADLKSGRKNLIINGGFDVWQRGTSFTGNNIFTSDRWLNYSTGSGYSWTRQEFSVGQTDVPNNPKYFMRLNNGTGQSSTGELNHRIEDVAKLSGTTVTLSFYARVAAGTPDLGIMFYQYFGSGGSSIVYSYSNASEWTLSTSWQKFTKTVTLDSVTGKTIGSGSYLAMRFGTPNVSDNIEISQVQLEVGSTATDFEHRSYGEELALCQRYYQAYGQGEPASGCNFRINGAGNGSNTMLTGFMFPAIMRAEPSLNYYGSNTDGGTFKNYVSGSFTSATAPNSTDAGDRSVRWNFDGNGSYPSGAYWIDVGAGSNQFSFTLDAEL